MHFEKKKKRCQSGKLSEHFRNLRFRKCQSDKLSEHFRNLRFRKCQSGKLSEHFLKLLSPFRKKAQIWYIDFMLGLLIFVIVIFIYYEYAHSINQDPGGLISEILMDAKSISSSLITMGSPTDWNSTNVEIIGLTDGNQRLMQDKLDMFANMSYSYARTKLRTPYDFSFHLEEFNGTRILIDGKEVLGLEATNSSDQLISMTRIVIYDSRLISMVVNVWED